MCVFVKQKKKKLLLSFCLYLKHHGNKRFAILFSYVLVSYFQIDEIPMLDILDNTLDILEKINELTEKICNVIKTRKVELGSCMYGIFFFFKNYN